MSGSGSGLRDGFATRRGSKVILMFGSGAGLREGFVTCGGDDAAFLLFLDLLVIAMSKKMSVSFNKKTVVTTATVNPTRYWKSELDQKATTVLKPRSFVNIIVFAVEDNFVLPTD
jgi:hypothetical protein